MVQRETAVTVDRDFARFGNKSYAINKINSVEVRERHPHGQGAMYVWGLLALIMLLAFLGSLSGPQPSSGPGWLLIGAVCGFLAYVAWKKSKIVEYQLFLMTSSSEAQALASRDADLILRLRNRIESAIAGQLAA